MRRHLILAAAAVAVAIVATLWLFPPQPTRTQPEVAATQTQTAWPLRGLLFGPSLDDEAHAPGTEQPLTIDVCGVGPVAVKSLDDPPPSLMPTAANGAAASQVLRRAVAELEASTSPSDQAIALHYQASLAGEAAGGVSTNIDACFNNDNCRNSTLQVVQEAAAPYEQLLVQLAKRSADPLAFSFAYKACEQTEVARTGVCDDITAQRWTELEPDNGLPWVLAASQAAKRGDTKAAAEAMTRAAAAPRFDNHSGALLRPIETQSLATSTSIEQLPGLVDLMGASIGTSSIAAYRQISTFCERGALDANRARICGQLASLLIDRDTSMLGAGIGIAIGERVGWSSERLAAVHEERDAMRWLSIDPQFMPPRVYACASIQALKARERDTLRFGETGALRRGIAASGRSVAELAQEYRDYERRLAQGEATARR